MYYYSVLHFSKIAATFLCRERRQKAKQIFVYSSCTVHIKQCMPTVVKLNQVHSPNNYFDFSDFPANQCEDKDWTIFFTGNIGNEPVC